MISFGSVNALLRSKSLGLSKINAFEENEINAT